MKSIDIDLKKYHLEVEKVIRNASPAFLYRQALLHDKAAAISDTGALMVRSGKKTGRSPKDKRIVHHPNTEKDIWWGNVNIKLEEHTFMINWERSIDYLNTRERLYVVDGFIGWDPTYRLKARIICSRPYHALFMHNMMIRPSRDELKHFGEPDFVIFNAGEFPANRFTEEMTSTTSVDLCFEKKQMVILGSEYAGEMKKGLFSVMNYLMPKRGILSMHCSANVGTEGDTALFFGLSGTGKTTLSADPRRRLIGDDEHCWTPNGIFNMEGGCYAKCINLTEEKEPEIFKAIRFGTVLENVVYDPDTHAVDFEDGSITENTRAAYPIEFIDNAEIPCVGGHPKNVIFLTCDAFGVLPPVSKLSEAQAMYHFISGYTAKVAGTEVGVTEPEATFSACFGAAFMVWHPSKYAELLAEKMKEHDAKVWLVNTGWSGGPYGVGKRFSLKYTRAIIDAILDGRLDAVSTQKDPLFGFEVPTECPNIPKEVMIPKNAWKDPGDYDTKAKHLAGLFKKNFEKYKAGCGPEILAAGPQ